MALLIRCIRFNLQASAPDFMFCLCQWGWLYPLIAITMSSLPFQQDWNGCVTDLVDDTMVLSSSFRAF